VEARSNMLRTITAMPTRGRQLWRRCFHGRERDRRVYRDTAAESSVASSLHSSPSVSARQNYPDPAVYEKNIISAKLHRKNTSQIAVCTHHSSSDSVVHGRNITLSYASRFGLKLRRLRFTRTLESNFGPNVR